MNVEEMDWICRPCAGNRGGAIPKGHMPTWHVGECDACGKEVEVTEPRDFTWPSNTDI